MPRGRPKLSGPEAQEIMDRRMRTLALRREGYTLAAIAEAQGVPMTRITSDVKWLREQGYDLGEGHTGRALPPPGSDVPQMRTVAADDDNAAVRREVSDRRIRGESILGISISMQISAHDVRRHLHDAYRLSSEGDVEARRELELARLDRMLAALDEGIMDGNPKAVNAAARVIGERSRLLGLYRPVQVEHTVITVDTIDAEMQRLTRELAKLEAPELDHAIPVDGEPVDD